MSNKVDRFNAIALIYGKPKNNRLLAYDEHDIDYAHVPTALGNAIRKVFTVEELHQHGGVGMLAYDYVYWYRAEEKRLRKNRRRRENHT